MRELLLLRHGRTESNDLRLFTGSQDVPLSPGGEAALLAARGAYPPADTFFTSGMLRAVQTLRLLYGDVPHTDIPALAEYNFGLFEGRGHDDLLATEPVYRAWLAPDGDDLICPGGESRAQFGLRVWEGWGALAAHPWLGMAVAVVHGGVIARLMGRLFPAEGRPATPDNGCGWLLALDEAGAATGHTAFAPEALR